MMGARAGTIVDVHVNHVGFFTEVEAIHLGKYLGTHRRYREFVVFLFLVIPFFLMPSYNDFCFSGFT